MSEFKSRGVGPRRLDPSAPAQDGPVRVHLNRPASPAPRPAAASGSTPRAEQTPVDSSGEVLGSEWTRMDLPSNFVPYEWPDLSLKLFFPIDHAKIARAVRYQNTSLVLDVIASTSSRDPRDWTFNDLQAALVWHKRNSYVNTAYTVRWQSRYGVQGTQSVTSTDVRETRMTKTREEYLEAKRAGYALATCRDIESFSTITDEDTIYLFDKAQWLDPAPLAGRIRELEAQGDRAASVTARIEELNRRGNLLRPGAKTAPRSVAAL